MKMYIEHKFDYPMDLVLKVTHYDVVADPSIYENMPNVTSVKRSHFFQHPDGRQDIEYTYCAHGQVPPLAQKLIKPNMLSWREISRWDPASRIYYFEIAPFFLANLFMCKGTWKYEERAGKVHLIMNSDIHVKVPLIGPIVEQAISKELTKNQNDNHKRNLQNLEKLVKENSAAK
jgi:hypothetical protein